MFMGLITTLNASPTPINIGYNEQSVAYTHKETLVYSCDKGTVGKIIIYEPSSTPVKFAVVCKPLRGGGF